ncbi:hypothetical protein PTTG_25559 [Puccinia triticina 1-1 BBBD Race 1]|uniref:Uncharacterized protein n=1 Tax=Puccinia triticina (isolate 1-1 / race 1 (BBBD)) TaxID=630390 RepID=A0A180H2A8_PUCT1|nr:hypothetical protein PTTG_25559 [Puccinia triticina 1-1 BBBD Race 1]
MSQEANAPRASDLDIDDPRLPKLQSLEHAEHVLIAFSQHQKQYNQQKASRRGESSSKELAKLIDANTKAIAGKVKAAIGLNARKRNALWADCATTKRLQVTLGKYRMRRVGYTEKARILKYRYGGESGKAGPDMLEEGVEEQSADAKPVVGRADAEGEDADGGRRGGGGEAKPGGDGADNIEQDRLAAGEGQGDVVWGQMAMVGRAAFNRRGGLVHTHQWWALV